MGHAKHESKGLRAKRKPIPPSPPLLNFFLLSELVEQQDP